MAGGLRKNKTESNEITFITLSSKLCIAKCN